MRWIYAPSFTSPIISACDCNMVGVVRITGWPDGDCVKDSSFRNIQGRQMLAGQCFCSEGWIGRRCDTCAAGWYPSNDDCVTCNCDVLGSESAACDGAGRCGCRVGYTGVKCDKCTDDKFSFPKCTERCFDNRAGVRCETCLPGYYMVSWSAPS